MQITESTWTKISEDYYEQMLEILPPLHMGHNKFMSSEPYKTNGDGQNLYFVGRQVWGTFEARLMTQKDYREI